MSEKKRKRNLAPAIFLIITILMTMLLWFDWAWSEEETYISIRHPNTTRYPTVSFLLSLADGEATHLPLLSDKDCLLYENGKTISGISIEPVLKKQEPMAVVLVIDTSGSMKGKPLDDAKAAAKNFLQLMQTEDEVAIVAFGSKPQTLSNPTTDKNALGAGIDTLAAQGETALYDAIVSGFDVLSQTARTNKNLIVISDGKDTVSANSMDVVSNRAKELNIPIFGVGLQSPEFDSAALQSICLNSGGELLLTPDSGALSSLFSRLAKYLHNQYRITYKSGRSSAKQLRINLAVKVSGRFAHAQTVLPNPNPLSKPSAGQPRKSPGKLPRYVEPSYLLLGAIPLSFLTVSLLVFAVLSTFFTRNESVREQLKFYDTVWQKSHRRPAIDSLADSRLKDNILKVVDFFARPGGFTDLIQLKLEQAGLPLRPLEVIFFHFMFTLTLGILGSIFAKGAGLILMVATGAALPILVLSVIIERRRALFHEQLPDTLTMIAGSLKAGYSFMQAISAAVDESSPPMSSELGRVLAEARLGLPLEEALEKMAQRVQEQNFTWTVMAINIQREVGGNLAELMEVLAETIRDRDRVGRQIKILTAEGKLSAIILVVLPFVEALILFRLAPGQMSLLVTTQAGLVILSLGLTFLLLGGIWLKRIVTIEV